MTHLRKRGPALLLKAPVGAIIFRRARPARPTPEPACRGKTGPAGRQDHSGVVYRGMPSKYALPVLPTSPEDECPSTGNSPSTGQYLVGIAMSAGHGWTYGHG